DAGGGLDDLLAGVGDVPVVALRLGGVLLLGFEELRGGGGVRDGEGVEKFLGRVGKWLGAADQGVEVVLPPGGAQRHRATGGEDRGDEQEGNDRQDPWRGGDEVEEALGQRHGWGNEAANRATAGGRVVTIHPPIGIGIERRRHGLIITQDT